MLKRRNDEYFHVININCNVALLSGKGVSIDMPTLISYGSWGLLCWEGFWILTLLVYWEECHAWFVMFAMWEGVVDLNDYPNLGSLSVKLLSEWYSVLVFVFYFPLLYLYTLQWIVFMPIPCIVSSSRSLKYYK